MNIKEFLNQINDCGIGLKKNINYDILCILMDDFYPEWLDDLRKKIV